MPLLYLSVSLLFASGASAAPSAGVIEPVDCSQYLEAVEDVQVECGVLNVPENRSRAGSRMIGVPYAIVRSAAQDPAPDPQIFMTGGPGGRTIPRRVSGRHPVLARRDLIYFEQRGTALGRPALQCPEYTEAGYQASLGAVSVESLAASKIDAAKACAARTRAEGADLAGYTTKEIAADIEDLRKALGIGKVNLYGLSYSGKVMTVYARDYPAATRSIVLNSPLTVEANYDEHGSAGMRRALDMVIEGCALDAACARAFPDLRRQFEKIIERAEKRPQIISVKAPEGEEEVSVRVDGRVLADALLNTLYSQNSLEQLPRYISAIDQSGAEAAKPLIDISRSAYAYLQRISVWCNEEYPFEDLAAIRRQETEYPEFAGVDQSTVPVGLCDEAGFGEAKPGPSENKPVKSDIPALIFSGEFDPATPPAWSAAMAARMSRASHLVVPGAGHGAGFADCPTSIMLAFLDTPENPVDISCITRMRGADFSRAAERDH